MKFNKKMEKFLKTRNFESLTKYMTSTEKGRELLLKKQDMTSYELYDRLATYINMIPHERFAIIDPINLNVVLLINEIENGVKVIFCQQDKNEFTEFDMEFIIGKYPMFESTEMADYAERILVGICGFLELLNHKEYRTGKKQIRTFKKQNSTFKMPTYTEVTYISNVKYLNDKSYNTGDGIKWEHSWRVRGHWRTIPHNTLGKDRKGDRSSLGRTWVNPGVRNRGLPDKNNPRILR